MNKISRRDFTKTSFALGATTALGSLRVLGANDRVNMGIIGCGDRGRQVWGFFLKQPDVNPAAFCDVYEPNMDKAAAMATGKGAKHGDFRRLLEMKDVDAVLVGTPDHWHALPTIYACQAGKDVYCEKPLSLTVVEGRKMVEAARKYNRVVQTGSQQRSGAHYQKAVQMVQNGDIGGVHKITAGFTRNVVPGFKPDEEEVPKECPKNLDWDMYLGPAPKVPYDPFRFLYHFRWFWDYSGGQMTNWGAHNLDIARWALKAKGPMAVAAFGGRYAIKDGGETPDVQEVIYQFPNALVTWEGREVNRLRDEYLVFHGTKGSLSIMRNGFTILPEIPKARSKNTTPAMEGMEMKAAPVDMTFTHVRNFLDCIKSRQRPNADVEEGHLTATMCHLGNIATRLNRSMKWDAEREVFLGDREANQMLSRPYRKPWKLEVA
jgi:predicted dehydrogenase